ncbi:hypothetical protein BEH94_08720 [Candidatus Altiarchaeales archaeon WOR_SM1_SCG]|nr:hypothetical protein BEH94_08720 [Candidatus Altiarchaeales archaeon WOR_SM1_SCG]
MFQQVIGDLMYPYVDVIAWFLILIVLTLLGDTIHEFIFKSGNRMAKGAGVKKVDRFLNKGNKFIIFIIAIVLVSMIMPYLNSILNGMLTEWSGYIPVVFIGTLFFAYIYFCYENRYKLTLKSLLFFIVPIAILII